MTTLTRESRRAVAPPGPLSFPARMLIGAGGLPMSFGNMTVQGLAIPFYQMMLGLSPVWLGFALLIPRLWDAFLDPIVGNLSDNFRSRFGRRRPFVIIGAVTMGVAYGMIWMVPPEWSSFGKVVYFISAAMVFYTCYAIFSIPYQALTFESSPDYNERTRVMAHYTVWYKVGDLSNAWIFPLSQLAIFASPVLGIRITGWVVGLLILSGVALIPGLFGKERYYRRAASQARTKLWDGLKVATTDKALLVVIALCMLKVMPGMLVSSMDHYLLVYYMNHGDIAVGSSWKAALSTTYGLVGLITIPALSWFATRYGKRIAMTVLYALVVVAGVAKWFLFVPGHTWIVLCDAILSAPIWIGLSMLLPSMIADICDEDELRSGHRREATYGAVYNWIVKFGISFAFFGTGLLLHLVGFDSKLGGDQSEQTFFWMRLSFVAVTIASALVGVGVAFNYPVSRRRAARTRLLLEARRGMV